MPTLAALSPPGGAAEPAYGSGLYLPRLVREAEPGRTPAVAHVLALCDVLLARRGDPVVRLNRVVALAEVAGADAALDELQAMSGCALRDFLPHHAVRADLLRRVGRIGAARAAYDAALALDPAPAERLWLQRRRDLVAP